MPDDAALSALMTRLDDAAYFARLGSGLEAKVGTDEVSLPVSGGSSLERDGWLAVVGFSRPDELAAIDSAIDALAREGLPPLFVYAYPALWSIGDRVAQAMSRALDAEYGVMDDAWAFRVPVGPGHAGWAAHRGVYELAKDRRAPDVLNVWIAVTDATVDNSCMFVVPLDRDPGYPNDLRSHAGTTEGIAIPALAGTALVWNANVLHWGGPSTERAKAPRTSITFTLRRDAPPPQVGDHVARLDVIADQILTYGQLEPTLAPRLRRWAELRIGMRNLVRARGDGGVRKAP